MVRVVWETRSCFMGGAFDLIQEGERVQVLKRRCANLHASRTAAILAQKDSLPVCRIPDPKSGL